MDVSLYFNCISDELSEECNSEYEDYLDCLTELEKVTAPSKEIKEKAYDRFTENILNEWKNDFDKELE